VILVLRAYLLTVPYELTEAGMVDGASLFGAFFRVILPVAVPGLVTAGLFAFLFAWGDFTFGLTLTTGTTVQPVTVGLYLFVGEFSTNWNDLMAGAVLTALPAIVLLLTAQRFITAGITAGAVKG
jgi:multiple sugar transport system permease protein